MRKIDPSKKITALRNRQQEIQKEIKKEQQHILRIEEDIKSLIVNGLPYPVDIELTQPNCSLPMQTMCLYCGAWIPRDGQFEIFVQPGDQLICYQCAHHYAPYLMRVFIPFIKDRWSFYREIRDKINAEFPKYLESQVPAMMSLINRYWKLKGFM